MKKILNDTEEINELFQCNYSKEIINEIKNFYFNGCNMECGTTRLENICHVSVSKSQTNYKSISIFLPNIEILYDFMILCLEFVFCFD